jgi:hypothetical protein
VIEHKGPCFEDTITVPVLPFTSIDKYQLNNQDYERSQFALSVSYAITIQIAGFGTKELWAGLDVCGTLEGHYKKGNLF